MTELDPISVSCTQPQGMTINFLFHYTTLLILPNRPQAPQQGDLVDSESPINKKFQIQNTSPTEKHLPVTWLHASNLITMATNGKPRLGTPVTPTTPTIASQINRNVPPKPTQPPTIPPPAPVIPVSLLQPNEQRLLITSFFGLLEVSSLGIE
jgi:hypothetical protein